MCREGSFGWTEMKEGSKGRKVGKVGRKEGRK
jgi:hypothetical protein